MTVFDTDCQGQEPCPAQDECRRAGLCLGSPEGVAYQEAIMKAFFERLFTDYAEPGLESREAVAALRS